MGREGERGDEQGGGVIRAGGSLGVCGGIRVGDI